MVNNNWEFKLFKCLMFKLSPNGKGDLWPQWNIASMENRLWR